MFANITPSLPIVTIPLLYPAIIEPSPIADTSHVALALFFAAVILPANTTFVTFPLVTLLGLFKNLLVLAVSPDVSLNVLNITNCVFMFLFPASSINVPSCISIFTCFAVLGIPFMFTVILYPFVTVAFPVSVADIAVFAVVNAVPSTYTFILLPMVVATGAPMVPFSIPNVFKCLSVPCITMLDVNVPSPANAVVALDTLLHTGFTVSKNESMFVSTFFFPFVSVITFAGIFTLSFISSLSRPFICTVYSYPHVKLAPPPVVELTAFSVKLDIVYLLVTSVSVPLVISYNFILLFVIFDVVL